MSSSARTGYRQSCVFGSGFAALSVLFWVATGAVDALQKYVCEQSDCPESEGNGISNLQLILAIVATIATVASATAFGIFACDQKREDRLAKLSGSLLVGSEVANNQTIVAHNV